MNKLSIKDKLILYFSIILIPFIIYAVYKNGYLLYQQELIGIIDVFKPLILSICSILIAFIINLIIDKRIKIDFNLLYALLISMIVSPNINYIIYFIILIVSLVLLKLYDSKLKFNYVAFIFIILYLLMNILGNSNFSNISENMYTFNYNILDIIAGRNIGGISSTSIAISILGFIILFQSIYYKKNIPIIICITYILLSTIYYLITKDYSLIINSEVIFGSIFVATLPKFSCYSKKGILFYSVLVGIITFIIAIFNKVIAIYIAIFLVSLIQEKIEKINIGQKPTNK